jgi:hypothetical protein
MQGDIQLSCQVAAAAQVESDEHAGMSWCDDDTMYSMIREDVLRSRRWDQTWVIIECS